jgi:hypothetical protein
MVYQEFCWEEDLIVSVEIRKKSILTLSSRKAVKQALVVWKVIISQDFARYQGNAAI